MIIATNEHVRYVWRGRTNGGVHALVWRSVQVYHELQELEEEDKAREEVQEIKKGESK